MPQKPRCQSIGNFVVQIATEMMTIKGMAARRVNRPTMTSAAGDLEGAYDRRHDLRAQNADLGKPSHAQLLGIHELLDSFGQEDSADQQADQDDRGRCVRSHDSLQQ